MTDSFPRRNARSRRFTLGRPRSFQVVADGRTVLFLRSDAGDDPVHHLWALEVATGDERRLVDARELGEDGELTAAERARRERARESGGGIVSFTTDAAGDRAAFVLGTSAWVVEVATGAATVVAADATPYDLRLSPDGTQVAAVVDGALHVGPVEGPLRPLVVEDGVTWGAADFVAAEEMQRFRGYWWSPDGRELLAARVDESDVLGWHIGDPANPDRPATEHRYPAAGTANPDVTLWRVDATDGSRAEVVWDRDALPYLAHVDWSDGHAPLLLVQSRDQRRAATLTVDGTTTAIAHDDRDAHWVEIVSGAPAWSGDRIARVLDRDDVGASGTRVLVVGDEVCSPPDLQVRALLAADADVAWVTASEDDPTQTHVFRIDLATTTATRVTDRDGVHLGVVSGGVRVEVRASLGAPTSATVVADDVRHEIASSPLDPGITADVELLELGERGLRGALVRPAGEGPWPLLLDPYGGPHAQRVVQSMYAWLTPAWFAQQGFAVLVVDGRGTPGRGPRFEREIAGDFATAPLQDQVDALHAAAEVEPRLDLDRVAIRGWSFGGYLSALACLRRPDVFRAGIVGAPVTDWHLYDTHYTERYLGHPEQEPANYERTSLLTIRPEVQRPLMLIHGLADDNVVAAHTLQLSSALLEAGHPHEVLPLSNTTHMTPQEEVAENLLLLQVDFLKRHL